MNCFFDEKGSPKAKLIVKGEHEEVEIEALIDTGFSGDLTLPLPEAIFLKLRLVSSVAIVLADGSIKNKLMFEGKSKLDKKFVSTDIILTEEGDAKVGIALLKRNRLTIDFAKDKISIK
ncbi:hypothetical protein A2897_01410 [Candidatus Woesebacteria bacterium RIFCSPLOWO2_01_FULL_44_24b]|nr:MAG: hypothetical protein A2897_01410 [Candidatus Woesebacteria bacterium RIFCSPLOWO2_01_FULL_44_24b]